MMRASSTTYEAGMSAAQAGEDAEHKLFFGKAVLIVRTKEGQAGDIKIICESDGLKSDEVAVLSK